jgi:hypothetical protein
MRAERLVRLFRHRLSHLPRSDVLRPLPPRRLFRDCVLRALEIGESDRGALAGLLLVHAVVDCSDVDPALLQAARWLPRAKLTAGTVTGLGPSAEVIERLLGILDAACTAGTRTRLATADVAAELLVKLCYVDEGEDEGEGKGKAGAATRNLKPRAMARLHEIANKARETLRGAADETDADAFMDMFEVCWAPARALRCDAADQTHNMWRRGTIQCHHDGCRRSSTGTGRRPCGR